MSRENEVKGCRKETMSNSNIKQIHVAMFPWFGYGHFIPFLHLSNNLAERGHKVSFLVPKSAQPKLEKLSHHPHLIHFFPLTIPHLQGLPPAAETCSDLPIHLHGLIGTAFDQTRDQVERLLSTLTPHVVLFDFASWVPSLANQLNIKTAYFSVVGASTIALGQPPNPEEPSSLILRIESNELAVADADLSRDYGSGLSLYARLSTSLNECDAIAVRTCREIEGRFCDHLAKGYKKPVFVTGAAFPETQEAKDGLEEKWAKWLGKFEKGSLVYCAFGSQIRLQKDQFQELVLGFELSGRPFLAALSPPEGCKTVEEALPEGFEERVGERGWVCGGWAPQTAILEHPSVGCFVSHCGFGSMWEALLSDCQIVAVPFLSDQIVSARMLGDELKVAVEAERSGENRWISKESLSHAIESVMEEDKASELIRSNHANLKGLLIKKGLQAQYFDAFVQNLLDLIFNNNC